MADLKTVIRGLECITGNYRASYEKDCRNCLYWDSCKMNQVIFDALALLKAQEPRLMSLEEVIERGKGAVLWVEEAQGVTWNLFPLEIELISTHPDTDTYYMFFITYHGCKKFEATDYGTVWRCWTERPTYEQREAKPWAKI